MVKKLKQSDLDFDEVVFDDFARGFDSLEQPLSKRAFILVAVLAFLVSFIALGRVFYLNVFKKNFYQSRADSNVHKEINLMANRGIIVDRFGDVLAENAPAFSVSLNINELVKDKSDSLAGVLKTLSEVLSIDEQLLFRAVDDADLEKTSSIIIDRNIATEEAIALKGLELPAVEIIDDYTRKYPSGSAFAHITGYTGMADQGSGIVGKSGLEAYYDDWLKGVDGKRIIYRDARARPLEEKAAEEPRSGYRLETTIDAELQNYFYNRLKTALEFLGRDSGVGIALNPQNGEILSLISLPSFDNNIFVAGGLNDQRKKILAAANKPLFNRAISGVYNPGSAIKPLVALAALEENIVDATDQIYSSGSLEIPNPYDPEKPSRFLDWKAHGWVDLYSALAKSSNIYFYAVGGGLPRADLAPTRDFNSIKGLGIDKLRHYWEKFVFGLKTGIDLPAENSGFLPGAEEKEKRTGQIWRIGDTYNVSIGQGDILVTPLQLLNFTASIGNGGKIYRPFLVKRVIDPNQKLIKQTEAEELTNYVDLDDLDGDIKEVQRGLEDAVGEPYGTAYTLSDLSFKTAGKTGSAQVADNTRTNAFFVGYGPTDNPQIAILVLIENAREGSLNAVPIARDVFEWYYDNRLATSR